MKTGSELTLKFPVRGGITGRIVESKQTYVGYKGSKEPNFEKEIDNVISIPNVYNFMFLPLLNHVNSCLGVLQLYNKKGIITEEDVKYLDPFKYIFGQSIYNLIEVTHSIDLTERIQKHVHNIDSALVKIN